MRRENKSPEQKTDVELLVSVFKLSPDTAQLLLKDQQRPGLTQLKYKSLSEIKAIPGIGHKTAMAIKDFVELKGRLAISEPTLTKICSSEQAHEVLRPYLTDQPKEHFVGMYLNRNNEVLGVETIFKGGISATIIDPKVVLKKALDKSASAVIVAHNHPSGSLTPSKADHEATRKLVAAGKLFDIHFLDHLIIPQGRLSYYSFADHGLMEPSAKYGKSGKGVQGELGF